MALVTPGFRIEKLPASLGGIADRVLVPADEVIERGIERKLAAFVGCNGAHQVGSVDRMSKDSAKRLIVFRHDGNSRHSSIQVRLAHFARIYDGKTRLLLESFCTTVPELRLVVQRVQNRRRVALTDAPFDTDGNDSSIRKSARRIVTCTAGNCSINRQASVKEKLFTKSDLLGSLWIVGRRSRTCGLHWHSKLFQGLGIGERTSGRYRRCLLCCFCFCSPL